MTIVSNDGDSVRMLCFMNGGPLRNLGEAVSWALNELIIIIIIFLHPLLTIVLFFSVKTIQHYPLFSF
jgi:hypothetical protein